MMILKNYTFDNLIAKTLSLTEYDCETPQISSNVTYCNSGSRKKVIYHEIMCRAMTYYHLYKQFNHHHQYTHIYMCLHFFKKKCLGDMRKRFHFGKIGQGFPPIFDFRKFFRARVSFLFCSFSRKF